MTTKFKTLIVVITGFLLFACKKSDFQYVSKAENKEITNRFFLYKENINPTVVTIINELKFQNTKTDFIRNFALKEGFAIWDKATVSTTLKRMNKNDSTESFDNPEDTVVFIPLVLENDNKVHSYLKAILNNGVIIMLGRNGDFEKYPFNTISPDSMSAEKFAILMMSMTKHVFGTENFKIIDNRLFPQYVVNSNKPNNFKIIKITSTTDEFSKFDYVCTYTYFLHCCGCGPCVGPYCDGCHLCLSVVENYCEYENSDPYPGFPWGGSPGGGGPTTYDPNGGCNNGTNKIIDGVPPCPPPNDGGGWIPSDEGPTSPCGIVDSLLRTTTFPQHLVKLRDSTVLNHEIGISFNLPDNLPNTNQNYTGVGSLSITIDPVSPVDGIMHNHYDTVGRMSIFSPEDIAALAQYLVSNNIRLVKEFTYTLVTDSTSYIIMIEDSLKFSNFLAAWFDTQTHFDAFINFVNNENHVGEPGMSNYENEKNFLKALNTYPTAGCGLKLFRGNPNMKRFMPIRIGTNGEIVNDPCL